MVDIFEITGCHVSYPGKNAIPYEYIIAEIVKYVKVSKNKRKSCQGLGIKIHKHFTFLACNLEEFRYDIIVKAIP